MSTIFIETQQFKQMISYKPYTENKQGKKQVKYSLLDSIKDNLGDKWYRLKEGTRQAFDMICFLSAELGFFYASDEYLADRHSISDRTIRTRMAELIQLGQVIKVHKRAKRCNGRGKAVYLFVNHPYFAYWAELLGLDITDFQTDFQTENGEIPCESKSEGEKKVPTYCLPTKQESDNNIDLDEIYQHVMYRINDTVKKGNIIKHVSSYVNRVVSSLERQALVTENMRRMAERQRQREELLKEFRETVGIQERKLKSIFYNWLVEDRSTMPIE